MEFERALFRIHQKALLTEPFRRLRLQLEAILPVSWWKRWFFKFDCIALYYFSLASCFHFVADSLELDKTTRCFFVWPEFVHCYMWFLCFSPLATSKVFIAAQILLLATLHSCYVGQSSCLPDVFRHAGISNLQ